MSIFQTTRISENITGIKLENTQETMNITKNVYQTHNAVWK